MLKTLVDSLPDFIFVKDSNSRYVIANTAHFHLLGANSMDELLGKTDFDFFSASSTAEFFADEQRVVSTGKPLLDKVETIKKDTGEGERWVLASKIRLYDEHGKVTNMNPASAANITSLKQAEDVLRSAKEQAEAGARAPNRV